MKMTELNSRILVEIAGQGSAIGKTLTSGLLRSTLIQANVPVQMIRVEAERSGTILRTGDIHVATEGFKLTAETPGGVVGVMSDAFDAIWKLKNDPGIVIIDWGAGLNTFRRDAYASTMLGQMLEAAGIDAYSFIIATRDPNRMKEALGLVKTNAELLAPVRTVVVLNEVAGTFKFARGSEQEGTLEQIRRLAGTDNIVTMPRIGAEALKAFAPAGLTIDEIVMKTPSELADVVGVPEHIALASMTFLAKFLQHMEASLTDLFPFPAADDEAA